MGATRGRRASRSATATLLAVSLTGLLLLAGCSGSDAGGAAAPRRTAAASGTSAAPATTPASPTPPATTPEAPPDPVSIEALQQRRYDGRGLRLGDVQARTDSYTRYFVTYRSGDLRVSGVLNVPTGKGPFPVVVTAHGYIDPAIYTNGRGMMREIDYLAREGYAVLHVDYRNHAQSSDDPRSDVDLRLGYTEDVVNAVLAVRRSGLAALDGDRVGLVGRSMGGGVIYNVLVAQPGLVDAAVVFAPVSSLAADNFERFIRADDESGDDVTADRIVAAHGAPEDEPAFWRNASPRPFFGAVTEPVLVHHGTADDTCPIRWSRATVSALLRAGKDVTYRTYDGEGHAFGPQWPLSMRRTVAFLDDQLAA